VIVVDASAAIELLLRTGTGSRVMERTLASDESAHVPHLFDIEVCQAVRRLLSNGELSADRAASAIEDLQDLPLTRHAHDPLLARIWSLRESMTAYDAAYVALAEALDAPLVTCDAKLARAHGHDADIELLK
jgi:predicted nucleic acid-binding protein